MKKSNWYIQIAKEQARKDTSFFVDYFLGMPAPLHIQEWYEALDHPEYDKILIRAPRRHAKSTAITVNYTTKYILYNPNKRVLLLSRTDKLVMGFLRSIRDHITNNKLIKMAFPEVYPLGKFTEHEMTLRRDVEYPDPTISGVGRLGTVTGRAIDLLIIDDIVDRKDAYSPVLMDKIWDWLLAEAFNTLEPNARVIVVGTTKRADDIYARLEERWSKNE
jgi:hypothetical protein